MTSVGSCLPTDHECSCRSHNVTKLVLGDGFGGRGILQLRVHANKPSPHCVRGLHGLNKVENLERAAQPVLDSWLGVVLAGCPTADASWITNSCNQGGESLAKVLLEECRDFRDTDMYRFTVGMINGMPLLRLSQLILLAIRH